MAIRSECAANAPEQTTTDNRTVNSSCGSRSRKTTRPSVLKTRIRALVAATATAAVLTGAPGCSLFSNAVREIRKAECLDEFMLAHRNKVFAAKAWYREQHCYRNRGQLSEFKAGFIQGYIDVANGSNGCIPAVAPSHYWGWKYQSPGGQSAINAWFAGYPMGVKAAEQDGVGHWGRAPVMLPSSSKPATETPQSTLMFAPDGSPITDEFVVPGSTKIIETIEPASPADLQELVPPAADARDLKSESVEVQVSRASHASVFEFGSGGTSDTSLGKADVRLSAAVDAAENVEVASGAAGMAMTFTLNDQPNDGETVVRHEAVDEIFESIELPVVGVSEQTPDSSDEIPFKFE